MNREQLFNLCRSLNLQVTEQSTVAEMQSLLTSYQPAVAPQLALATTPTTADAIFRVMDTDKMSTFPGVRLVFIAPSKSGIRLIVRRAGSESTFAVYVFEEVLVKSKVEVGDICTILAEQRTSKSDGKLYWNATALSKQE